MSERESRRARMTHEHAARLRGGRAELMMNDHERRLVTRSRTPAIRGAEESRRAPARSRPGRTETARTTRNYQSVPSQSPAKRRQPELRPRVPARRFAAHVVGAVHDDRRFLAVMPPSPTIEEASSRAAKYVSE